MHGRKSFRFFLQLCARKVLLTNLPSRTGPCIVRAVHSPVEGAPQHHSWIQNRKTPLDRKVWTGHLRMPSLEGAVAAKLHDYYSWL